MPRRFDVHSPEQQAERVANEHYRQLQTEVIATVSAKLSARKMRLDESDLEEAYCQAWHAVCETIKRGRTVSNLTGMLVEITWRRAVDVYRELRPGQRVDVELDRHGVDPDADEQLDDQIKLERFIARARERLNARECEALSLCVIHGYPRAEAAQLLGLKRSQMEKLMDGAMKKIGGIVASISARGCGGDEWARLLKDYALGLIAEDDRDYPRAAAHVASCGECRRYVNGLRGLAAIFPPVVLPFGRAAAGSGAGVLHRLASVLRSGHGGRGLPGAGDALSTASGSAAGGAGAGSVAGSLSAGTLAKGVAVIAAGAAAVALAVHGGGSHLVLAQHTPVTHAQNPRPASASASAVAATARSSATTASRQAHGRGHHSTTRGRAHLPAGRRPLHRAGSSTGGASSAPGSTSEFATEGARYSTPTSPPTPAAPAPSETASIARVNREFGFER